MKRLIAIIIVILAVMGLTYAEDPAEITIILDGDILHLEEAPYIRNGRTLVPVRYLFEPLGLEVTWDAERFVAIGENANLYIEMPIGSIYSTVNGESVILDSPAVIINNRTYVPLRFVAESTGAEVLWNGGSQTIEITSGDIKEKNYADRLETIYTDATDFNGPNFLSARLEFNKIVDELLAQKEVYIEEKKRLNTALIQLGRHKNITLASADVTENMAAFHHLLVSDYETSIDKIHLVSSNDYYDLYYDYGYVYTYIKDFEFDGYQFAYTDLEEGYILSLTPYSKGKKNGIAFRMAFKKDHSLIYEAYSASHNDQPATLDYTAFTAGVESFDEAKLQGDVVLNIEPNGVMYIPPSIEGVSDFEHYGVGYMRLESQVEYVGYLDHWDRTGEGMYFAPEDDNTLEGNLLELRVDEIIEEQITASMSDAEKVRVIHDYLASHIIYDNIENPLAHTAYGALIDGVAVCDGYSEAFKYILDKMAIENVLIFGEGESSGDFTGVLNHVWNLVKINTHYEHIDLTWNDDDVNQTIIYKYYLKDNDFMDDTHQWDQERYKAYIN